ncbi:MAG: bifunctional methylenetetrahydrofolate dehydrogenase/methenyltetrahydrofolate cyclohydrolase FolD [Chloroflexi bacterium]|nr:bifunctional methylenetetrahydrofolate dehydrogenase/methenyltetrahydrofolate cyclohydrolase FolD [Chloroflexota bacterium]MCI0575219.1 bifunctional methylenetetrahydrofolate dehydrogenase/methenyltetrahydrofolate cyclohydrolase FolD [Chloroflexota bacterium]MCI0643821.1 bifunctional methylenetetrahydrofolate dehydrogenase/methenyltetrahydrofolate cyclohydrolase FolD [Chloroflexota bacterium]MCI0726081.1 bifunctional methylenetetrahydrofolate dehydrogenase/methenyltetrahydrofolate cyclohydrol
MTAQLIDGKSIAAKIREEIGTAVAAMQAQHDYVPGLATVLVGENPASATYVRMKQKACAEAGIRSIGHELPAGTGQTELEELVRALNADPQVNGILVQLPLPDHLDDEAVLNSIDLGKDVDGFHPVNIGRLAMKGRDPLFIPCTPYGVMALLEEVGVRLSGAEAVVVGRSNIVGLPVAMLLQKANATVTICHSRTRDLAAHTRPADVLIAAIGRAEMITGDMIKPGAVVIDVGVNQKEDPTAKRGYRLVGDVEFESAVEVAGAITPVPGGVGPMTIAMLLKNTLRAAELALA